MLSLRNVHVHITKLHILQGVDLEVKEGECAALLGRNGVGKTTTLRSIMGLVPRSSMCSCSVALSLLGSLRTVVAIRQPCVVLLRGALRCSTAATPRCG